MKKLLLSVAGLFAATSQVNAQPRRAEVDDGLRFEAPVTFHNITVVPVSTDAYGPFERYTLLEEGLGNKSLAVRELAGNSNQAQVSAVQIKNRGGFAAFLLGGEMILGGKQDRIIQADTIVPNDGKWHEVEVFCVEQGRWQGRNMKFSTGAAMAHGKLRQAALTGEQGEVWAEVARKNSAHGTANETQTYRRTVQNAKLRKQITGLRKQVIGKLPTERRLAGFVFAINGDVRIADLFGNPVLFDNIRDKLLSAYILEALEHQVDRGAKSFGSDAAQGFVNKAKRIKKGAAKKSGRAMNYTKRSKDLSGTEAVDQKTGATVKESYHAH